jgi:diaminopimelate epimerase
MKAVSVQQMTRMSGAGNTFIIANGLKDKFENRSELAKKYCTEYVGFNTDGFLIVEANREFDFSWDFYNADGSPAEMCGNAARCAALYYFNKINKKQNIRFLTTAGPIEAEILSEKEQTVCVKMPKTEVINHAQIVQVGGKKIRGFFVNTGVPHMVLQSEPDTELARLIRNAGEFGKKGTNVTFVEVDEGDFIQAVTFERGVEDFTLACGTGAVAAAAFHHHLYPQVENQVIEMPGGILSVAWNEKTPFLTGEAEFHFDFFIYEELP